MSTQTTTAGNGLPSIKANDIEVTLGMKVQYFDMANQNSPIKIVTEIDLSAFEPYELTDTITLETSRSTLRGFGWTVVQASKEVTVETFTEATQTVDAIHTQLEHLTPPEALEILRMVEANLKAEIRCFNEVSR